MNDQGDVMRRVAQQTHHYKQISVRPCEHWDVHRHMDRVGLIQAHAKVSLPTQEQQNEDADVHESNTGCSQALKKLIEMHVLVEACWVQG